MSEDETRRVGQQEEQGDEVEAHRRLVQANDEGSSEDENDVEAHLRRTSGPRREA